MNRLHEVYKRDVLLLPQAIAYGSNATGAYAKVISDHDLHFHVAVDALLVAETVTVEVYQAKTSGGGTPDEITACETVFIAPAAGAANAEIIISLNEAKLSEDYQYVTVKVSNTAGSGSVVTYADLIQEAPYRGADLNDTTDEVTVV